MKYFSTNLISPLASFKEATMLGQPFDKGLFFPTMIPKLNSDFLKNIKSYSNQEIAFEILKPFVNESIPNHILIEIIQETINFELPLKHISKQIKVLELFHGPTLAFKDVGAKFMSMCLSYFLRHEKKKATVLVATSGDTGGAVAHGFHGAKNIDVIILYPSGKVSSVQEKQLTTLGQNITAIEVNGNFDDCQRLVKEAFLDKEINHRLFLTSANSINIARWLPQQIYYAIAMKQWEEDGLPVISVPSGNLGNVCAGILCGASGLAFEHFIIAGNVNNTIENYFNDGLFSPKLAQPTLSNAMDVGLPSNFVRLLEILKTQSIDFKSHISSYTISDDLTIETIQNVYQNYVYLLDPHGAVGYASLNRYLAQFPKKNGYFLETAHPIKFPEAIKIALGKEISVPNELKEIMLRQKDSIKMNPESKIFKEFLLNF